MALLLIPEDGTGIATANSYASQAEGDSFHEQNFHTAAGWAALTSDQKDQSLITATRVIDQQWRWNGFKATSSQALQWPRAECPDPDRVGVTSYGYVSTIQAFLPSDEIQAWLKNAVIDYGYALTVANFEKSADGEGLDRFSLEGVFSADFNHSTRPDIMPQWIQSELSKYGSMIGAGFSQVKVIRT